MKKILLSFAALTSLSMVGMLFFNQGSLYSSGTGAAVSTSCTACHGGSVNTSSNLTIVLKDNGTEVTSYEAGKTYDVTVKFSGTTSTKVGFALSATGGVLSVKGNDHSYQKVSNYLTHTLSGTAVTSGVATWTGTWTAPASSGSNITFQVYINESNADNTDQGDVIYGKSVSVPKSAVTGISDVSGSVSYSVYPNPVSDVMTVSLNLKQPANLGIAVYGLDGKLVSTLYDASESAGAVVKQFPVAHLSKGIYLLEVKADGERSIRKLMID